MKACVLHAVGDLRYEEVGEPLPRAGEVLLRVGACGVCGSDIPRVFSKGTYTFPTIPGHEFSGTVVAAGPRVDRSIIGRRAAVFPLIPCGKCSPCRIGAYAQCEDYDYLGSRCDGAFAEYVCAPAENLYPLPDEVSLEEGAMVEPLAVAIHALRQVGLDAGDSVLVFGAGPIGVMVALWARAWGASRVLLVDIDVARLRFVHALGFDHLLDATQSSPVEWVRKKTGAGADVVIEATGSTVAFEQSVQCARRFGRVTLLGNPAGEMRLSQKAYWDILRNELTLKGSWNSTIAPLPKNEWQLAIDFMAAGRIDVKPLVTHRTGLVGLYDHLIMIRDRKKFSNKVLFVNSQA
ncbi:MAG: galactitol-1-phosphate 5-dehydrogenase [Candidatus Hydrogenedentes bacterium]|nr:galactitol-1-phosphate 5-dehydrogenase [Candidatus Hydrogenedentota bacterium]